MFETKHDKNKAIAYTVQKREIAKIYRARTRIKFLVTRLDNLR